MKETVRAILSLLVVAGCFAIYKGCDRHKEDEMNERMIEYKSQKDSLENIIKKQDSVILLLYKQDSLIEKDYEEKAATIDAMPYDSLYDVFTRYIHEYRLRQGKR